MLARTARTAQRRTRPSHRISHINVVPPPVCTVPHAHAARPGRGNPTPPSHPWSPPRNLHPPASSTSPPPVPPGWRKLRSTCVCTSSLQPWDQHPSCGGLWAISGGLHLDLQQVLCSWQPCRACASPQGSGRRGVRNGTGQGTLTPWSSLFSPARSQLGNAII